MTTYYVSKDSFANDGNVGTSILAPKLTIAGANAVAGANDTVLLRAGDTFRETVQAPANGITYSTYGTGQGIISGANIVTGWSGPSAGGSADLSAWTETDTANKLDANAAAKRGGSGFGMKTTNNGTTTAAYLTRSLPLCAGLHLTFYVAFPDAAANWTDLAFVNFTANKTGLGAALGNVAFRRNGTNMQIYSDMYAGADASGYVTFTTTSDTSFHKVELRFKNSSDATGYHVMIVDGITLWNTSGLTTIGSSFDTLNFGWFGMTNIGTASMYWDDVSATDQFGTPLFTESFESQPTYSVSLSTQPNVLIRNTVRQTLGSSATSLQNNQWFWAANVLYYRNDAGNPDGLGLLMEGGFRNHCWDNFTTPRSNLKLTNIALTGANSGGLSSASGGSGLTITQCTVSNCYNPPSSTTVIDFDDHNPVSVTYCTFFGCSGEAIGGHRNTNVTIEHNTIGVCTGTTSDAMQFGNAGTPGDGITNGSISYNICNQFGSGNDKGCIELASCTGVTVAYNDCSYGNYGFGLGASNSNMTFHHNTVRNSGGQTGDAFAAAWHIDSFGATGFTNCTFHHNLIVSCLNGFSMEGETLGLNYDTMKFYHNTIANCTRTALQARNTLALAGEFKDNIIYASRTPGLHGVEIDNTVTVIGGKTWVSDYNCIFPEVASHFVNYFGTNYNTLAAYTAGASQDSHSIKSDPVFVNNIAGPFLLQLTSPCRDIGTPIGGINTDFVGSAPDLGYAEYAPGGGVGARWQGGAGNRGRSRREDYPQVENAELADAVSAQILPGGGLRRPL